MWKTIQVVLRHLMPAGLTNDPDGQQRWRWTISAIMCSLVVVVATAIILATGHAPGLSSGYVLHSEMALVTNDVDTRAKSADAVLEASLAAVRENVDFITTQAIEQSIRSKLITRCMTNDAAFKQELGEEVQTLEDQYYKMTKRGYKQPNCSEL